MDMENRKDSTTYSHHIQTINNIFCIVHRVMGFLIDNTIDKSVEIGTDRRELRKNAGKCMGKTNTALHNTHAVTV